MKPNCYNCRYRGTIPGDMHSCCRHPDLQNITDDPIGGFIEYLSNPFAQINLNLVMLKLKIEGNAHGISRGWFVWPFNFDPVWLKNCEGFKDKNDKKNRSVPTV